MSSHGTQRPRRSTSTAPARRRTTRIAPNAARSPLNAGRLEFDPLSAGTTVVSASIPGFIATGAANMTVTINL
jgi:hypothetical protein